MTRVVLLYGSVRTVGQRSMENMSGLDTVFASDSYSRSVHDLRRIGVHDGRDLVNVEFVPNQRHCFCVP